MEILLFILIPFFVVGLVTFVFFVLSRLGWYWLHKAYPFNGDFKGDYLDITGARINVVNYNGVLDFRYNQDGLYLNVIPLFKLFHPPILIPWEEIVAINQLKVLFIDRTKLTVHKRYRITINIPTSGFEKFKSFVPEGLI